MPDDRRFNFVGTPPNEFAKYKYIIVPSKPPSETPYTFASSKQQSEISNTSVPSKSPSETSYTLVIGIIIGVIVLIGCGYMMYNNMNYRHMKHNKMSHNMHKLRGSSNLNYDFNNVKVRDGYYYYNF